MSEDNTAVVVSEAQMNRGDRGKVGVATPSLTLKERWYKERAKVGKLSLRAFARQLVKDGDTIAKDWFDNKAGLNNQARSAANVQMAKTCASATKLSRKKSKGGGGKAKPAADATAK